MLLTRPYFRERAVEYARRWALSRNPLFTDFTDIGGDCTNFVSQCLLAGCCTEDFSENFGWYYIDANDRAPAWSGVEYLFSYLTGKVGFAPKFNRPGPVGMEVRAGRVEPGDIVQLYNEVGDYYHSLIVSEVSADKGIIVCAHSDDHLDRPLYEYVNAAGYRFIHIQAALTEVGDDECFANLLEGKSIN